MADLVITLCVDTTGITNNIGQPIDPSIPTHIPIGGYCTLSQLGRSIQDDPGGNIARDISSVHPGDIIQWNGVSVSRSLPEGVDYVIVNIVQIGFNNVFGAMYLKSPNPTDLNGGTGGTCIIDTVNNNSTDGALINYSILFNYDTYMKGFPVPIPSPIFSIDPKIHVNSTEH